MENHDSSTELSAKQQKLELKMLNESLPRDKKIVDSFLNQPVPEFILKKLGKLKTELNSRCQNLRQRKILSFQQRTELKNIEWLQKSYSKFGSLKYLQLLKILYKFPKNLQLGIDEKLGNYLSDHPSTKELKRCIIVARYVAEGSSLQKMLTDCYVLSRLRELQIVDIAKIKPGESPIAKTLALEEGIGIIPGHFLVERRLGGDGIINLFQGMDLANNMPIVVKYLMQVAPASPDGPTPSSNMAEARKRFEREARAFEKLEQHRQSKEKEMLGILENAKQKIEEATREENFEKMQEGFKLFKQGELMCDRHFVKTYCLATGKIYNYATGDNGLFTRQPGKNVAFMIMEYLPGMNLRQLIDQHKQEKSAIPLPKVVAILEGILQALEYCHEENIIHRDIRPENILLTEDLKVRLTNLGMAKVEDMTQLTAQGAIVGIPGYAAPEGFAQGMEYKDNFSHLIAATDHRFDIYSVGCVAYEMLLGRPPFMSEQQEPDKKNQDLIVKHLKEEPIMPGRFRQEISDDLNRVVMTMLSKRPEKRFSSTKDALTAVNATKSGSSEVIQKLLKKIGGGPRLYPGFAPKFWYILGTFALVLLLSISIVGYLVWKPPAPDKVINPGDSPAQKEAKGILQEFKQKKNDLQKKWQEAEKLRIHYNKEFPIGEGYLQLSGRIDSLLKTSQAQINQIEKYSGQERSLLKKEPEETLKRIKQYKEQAPYDETQAILERIISRIKYKTSVAQDDKKDRQDQEMLQKTTHALKSYLFAAQAKFLVLEEKQAILSERYPPGSGYPKIPAQAIKDLQDIRTQAREISKAIDNLNNAILSGERQKAIELIEPYRKFSLTSLGKLEDIEESISDVMKLSRKKQQDREEERMILRGGILLKTRQEQLQKYLPEAKKDWQKLNSISKQSENPKDLFGKAEIELYQLKKARTELIRFEQEDRSKAVSLVRPYLRGSKPTVGDKIKLFQERINDQIKIIQVVGEEEKLKQQTIELLAITKKSQAHFQNSYERWQEKWSNFREELPGHKLTKSSKMKQLATKVTKTDEDLRILISDTHNKIKAKDLKSAYQTLIARKKDLPGVKNIADELDKNYKYLLKAMDLEKRKKRYVQAQSRCKRTLAKLEKHVANIESHMNPLIKEIEQMAVSYPSSQKYPQVNKKSKEILKKVQNSLENYKKVIRRGKYLLGKKKPYSAFRLLKKYEGKNIGSTLVTVLQKVQDDIYATRTAAIKFKTHRKDIIKIEKLLAEIKKREEDLQKTLPSVRSKLEKLKKYSGQVNFTPEDNVLSTLEQAKMEVDQLQSLIHDGEDMKKNKLYKQAIRELEPYSKAKNPDISLLPEIMAYESEYSNLLDPKKRRERIERQKAKTARQAKLDRLKHPPGSWYIELEPHLKKFKELERDILESIEGKGSALVYSRIQTNWGKIAEYPVQMAELKEMLRKAQAKGSLPKEAFDINKKALLKYAGSKTISIDAKEELRQIAKAMSKIERNTRTKWVEEETLRELLRALNNITRKFKEPYEQVYSELLNRS